MNPLLSFKSYSAVKLFINIEREIGNLTLFSYMDFFFKIFHQPLSSLEQQDSKETRQSPFIHAEQINVNLFPL